VSVAAHCAAFRERVLRLNPTVCGLARCLLLNEPGQFGVPLLRKEWSEFARTPLPA